MPTYKCKFCETAAKTMRLLKRHAAEVHPKESTKIKESLALVDAKLQSLSEGLVTEASSEDGELDSNQSAATPDSFTDRLDCSDKSNPDLQKTSHGFSAKP